LHGFAGAPAFVGAAVVIGLVAAASACGPASIGEEPTGDAFLPDRTPTPDAGSGNGGGTGGTDGSTGTPAATSFALTVTLSGSGTGTVASTPTGLTCSGTTCTGSFPAGATVTLAPSPASGSVFAGWSGACTGSSACAPVMNADVAVGAALESVAGSWTGTYTNTRTVSGCTFNNAGDLHATIAAGGSPGGAFTTAADVNGLEIRQIPGCALVTKTTGNAASSGLTVAGDTLTGTWTMTVQGVSGTLAFPFTATVVGKKITGTWTCSGCTGSFTLAKP
jgi:hypothetical protein